MKVGLFLAVALAASGSNKTFSLPLQGDSVRVKNLEEVVVTGTNQSIDKRLLPYTVSVVGSRQIESTGKTQLLSALSGEVPSLFVTQRNVIGFGVSSGGSGGIKIRGIGGSPTNSVLMMVDGQPQFAGIFSHHVADFYETEYVDHVEVLRGPASVIYGSNAVGGVINVITKTPADGVLTTLSSQYGSYGTWQSSLTNSFSHGGFSSYVALGYDRTNGLQKNFDYNQKSAYAKIGYRFSDKWRMAADYSIVNFVGNDPIYARLSNPESTDIYHQNVTRGAASLSASNKYEHTNGVVRAYYSYGNHYIDDPRHFHSLDDRFGITAYQSADLWKDASASVGFDFDVYAGRIPMSGSTAHHEGSKSTMARHKVVEYSPYITVSQHLFADRLAIDGGLRMANSNMFGTHWVPQIGLVWNPDEHWTAKASLAKGFRNPSFRELYLYAPANPDLKPESMMNYEVTAGWRHNQLLVLELTGYYSKGKDMIQVLDMKNQNTGSFINKGIEVSAKSRPLDNLAIHASYSYLYTSLPNLTAAPRNQYNLGVWWRIVKSLFVDARLNGVGGLWVAQGEPRQNYALLGLKVTYEPWRHLELFANLDNITNKHYVINRGYEMPGFTAMGGFKLKF